MGGGNLPLVQECYSVDRRNQTVETELSGTLTNCGGGDNYNTVMQAIAFEPGITKRDGGHSRFAEGVSSTIRRDMGDNQTAVAIAKNIIGRQVQNGGNGVGAQQELAYTQNASGVMGVANHATVRKLLPVECERLMGFPDNHTRIPWKGKPEEDCPDSPRYKACGNSMCVNVMRWIGIRIENVERKMEIKK
jgi:site-specific DNA-cytosine methylase